MKRISGHNLAGLLTISPPLPNNTDTSPGLQVGKHKKGRKEKKRIIGNEF